MTHPVHSEAPVGVWMWLALILVINALWIGMDLWLGAHGYEALTTELREGLHHQLWGPLIAFGVFGTAAAFIFHMFLAKFY